MKLSRWFVLGFLEGAAAALIVGLLTVACLAVALNVACGAAPAPKNAAGASCCACSRSCDCADKGSCECGRTGGLCCTSCTCAVRQAPLLARLLFQGDLDRLAADDFQVRQQAEARLSRWAWLTWKLCDRPFTDPERRRRAARVVARVVPASVPPIAVLDGKPLPEWVSPDGERFTVGTRPGEGWRLAWLRPRPPIAATGTIRPYGDRFPFAWLVWHYGEMARSQHLWKDWQLDADGREATRLLARDLLHAGVPVPLVDGLLAWMRQREEALATRTIPSRWESYDD